MNDPPIHEEHEALLADERPQPLAPDEAAELTLMAGLLANPSTWTEPNAGLEDAVLQAVARAQPATGTSAPAAATGVRATRARRRRRVVLSIGAAAAAIAIIIGATVVARREPKPNFEAQLNATGLAPGAGASADITSNRAGFHIELDAHGLPALPPGEYYQAWLENAAGTLVPIGTFSSDDRYVTLWSGVSPKDFPTLTVTIEAADNDQATSGRRVLTGDVRPS